MVDRTHVLSSAVCALADGRAEKASAHYAVNSDKSNQLVALLPKMQRQQLSSIGKTVPLTLGEVLCKAGEDTQHVYFPTAGFISLVSEIPGEPGLEVGMIGREGMLGVQLALGVKIAPLYALVQGAGAALRIEASVFLAEIAHNPALRVALDRYLYVLMAQLATAAACTRFHSVGPRLARWLLMSQDRAESDHFHLTQDFLSYMLGVRRVGVTRAAGALQNAGLIGYHRGEITVLDRTALEATACSCYASDRLAYGRQFARAR